MLYAYNETDKKLTMDYRVYNYDTMGSFELKVGDDPESVVILTTESADVMENIKRKHYPMEFDKNPFIKPLIPNKLKYVYDDKESNDFREMVCISMNDELSKEESDRRKFMSSSMVVLVLKRDSRFYFGKSNQVCKPIVRYRDDYMVIIMLIKWRRWKDLKFPMDIKIKSADGDGHHKKIVFGTREAAPNYLVNNITVEDYDGEFPEFQVSDKKYTNMDNTKSDKPKFNKDKKPYAPKHDGDKKPYNNNKNKGYKDHSKEDHRDRMPKQKMSSTYGSYGNYPAKEPNRKFQNRNKGNSDYRGRR